MLATFLIESALLMYVVWRYKLSPIARLIAVTLTLLATFQLAEYNVCGGMNMSAAFWSRIGFVVITLLPPLGIHLVYLIAGRKDRTIVYASYAVGAVWAAIFGSSEWAFIGHACGGNYAIFNLRADITPLYGLYYYGWLMGGVVLAMLFAREVKNKEQANALLLLVVGYFIFLVPTATANIVKPETVSGIPSIMCGFAVLFALILVFGILPLTTTKKDRN